jgi:GMP synthase (glutamine-hydrolysing)
MSNKPTPAPSRTALALRHIQFEDLGILDRILVENGYRVEYVDVGVDEIDPAAVDDADLLIVLGGTLGVYDVESYPLLRDSKAAVARRLHGGRPMLGICLGAQLIAEALGATVRATGEVEIGYGALELTEAGLDSPLRALHGAPVLHWHGDEFTIPEGARHLARTRRFPHQAFSTDTVLALQFHLEADHRAIERWLVGHAHELAHTGIDPRDVREQARQHGALLERVAADVFEEWLDAVTNTAPVPADAHL